MPGPGQDEETDKTDMNQRKEDESNMDNRTERNSISDEPCRVVSRKLRHQA